MIEEQLIRRGVRNPRVVEAMAQVPRHRFVPQERLEAAYADAPIDLGFGLAIPPPYVVARMLEALELMGTERVLEVGTGSGYLAALLSRLARDVYSVETIPELGHAAGRLLAELGCRNVHVLSGNGSIGWVHEAPYDAILMARACPFVPHALSDQLGEDGRLVLAVGNRETQRISCLKKQRRTGFEFHDVCACSLPLLFGYEGWASGAPPSAA